MTLLEAHDLTKHFPLRSGLFSKVEGAVRAVDGVSFTIEPGRTLGVVGESGCGKSTTAKLVLKLEEPTGGDIRFDGQSLRSLDGAGLRRYRKSVQAVFQDPYASLNPRMRVGAIIAEPLVTNESLPSAEVRKRIRRQLDLSYLFIAHDLAAVAHMSHTIAVMYLGKIVEIGDADTVAKTPKHPYTQ